KSRESRSRGLLHGSPHDVNTWTSARSRLQTAGLLLSTGPGWRRNQADSKSRKEPLLRNERNCEHGDQGGDSCCAPQPRTTRRSDQVADSTCLLMSPKEVEFLGG